MEQAFMQNPGMVRLIHYSWIMGQTDLSRLGLNIIIIIFSLLIKTTTSSTSYTYSMNVWSQVITRIKLNCVAAMQGCHHIIHLI